MFRENGSKNNPGGISCRQYSNKEVPHFENKKNPSRDFVSLYCKYISKCPQEPATEFFFLQSKKNFTDKQWYNNCMVGHNPLGTTIKRLCSIAGITGRKTNHSLRATAATRLFQKGIDEQLIMKVTGHRSIDGVRAYKRPSIEQFKEISGVLQKSVDESIVPTKRIKQDDDEKENQEPTSGGTNVPSFTFEHCSNVTINVSK